MKRIVCFLMCFMLIFSLCACGGTNEESPYADNGTSTPVTDNNQETQNTASDTSSDDKILTGTYKVPLQKIYVDTPDFNLIEEGYTRIFLDGGTKSVAFTCMYDDEAESVSEAYEKTTTIFYQNVDAHYTVKSISVLKDETVEMNGITAYKFEGVSDAGYYEAYVCGYSFVYQGFPCSIIGVVIENEQTKEEKQLVKQIVDEMMKTVRNSK